MFYNNSQLFYEQELGKIFLRGKNSDLNFIHAEKFTELFFII